MKPITLIDYLGQYAGSPDATPERVAFAGKLLAAANIALEHAEEDGVVLHINPHTGGHLGGTGHGGFRDQACTVGAAHSAHREGRGIDIFDPERSLARWSLQHSASLKAIAIIAMEDPRWTPTWVHWQTREVVGKFSFIPSPTAPLASALPEQQHIA